MPSLLPNILFHHGTEQCNLQPLENGMEYVIWAKGPALGPVRSFSADRREKKKYDRVRRKHPTKLVEAAACCLLSPLTMSTGWILRGPLDNGILSSAESILLFSYIVRFPLHLLLNHMN